MSLQINNAKKYIGFSKKSGAIKFGVDDICKLKHIELILVSESLHESSMKKIGDFSKKYSIDLFKLSIDDFENLIDNRYIKAIAILDKNLASEIKKNLTNL